MNERLSVDTQKLDDQVLTLYNAHCSRNEISKRLKVSTYQVDQSARRQGLTFDTERTAKAVAVRQQQAVAERARMAEKFRKIAELELDSVLSGANTPADRKNQITVAAVAVDKDLALAEWAKNNGHDEEMEAAAQAFVDFTRAVALSVDLEDLEDDPDDH